jgi:hypothetical protein
VPGTDNPPQCSGHCEKKIKKKKKGNAELPAHVASDNRHGCLQPSAAASSSSCVRAAVLTA